MSLWVSFAGALDEYTQNVDVRPVFSPSQQPRSLDVSFLLGGGVHPKEGVLVVARRCLSAPDGVALEPTVADESDVVDKYPGDGDWFFSWEDLSDELAGRHSTADSDGSSSSDTE